MLLESEAVSAAPDDPFVAFQPPDFSSKTIRGVHVKMCCPTSVTYKEELASDK